MARRANAITLALTGRDGGTLSKLADFTIYIPSPEQVEDAHLVIAHSLCVVLREQLRTFSMLQEVEHSVFTENVGEHMIADLK